MTAVFHYILTKKLQEDASEAQLEVLQIITQANQLRRCADPVEAAALLRTSQLSLEHLTPCLSASEEVKSPQSLQGSLNTLCAGNDLFDVLTS